MKWFRRAIESGMEGSDVAVVQRKLGAFPTGRYDDETVARVKGVQRMFGVEVTGVVNENTAEALGETPDANPGWWHRKIELWTEGPDVRHLRKLLGLAGNDDRHDPDSEAAVKRLQGTKGLPVTGEVDEATARVLG